jgi:hypothetical protein
MRVIKYVGSAFAWLAAFVCATWAAGALYFDFPAAGKLAVSIAIFLKTGA